MHPHFQPDAQMSEANMVIFVQSAHTKQVLKWALLCAATRGCIDASDTPRPCLAENQQLDPFHTCNLQDQSTLSILVNNAERRRVEAGDRRLVPHSSYRHPSRLRERHILRKKQTSDKRFNRCTNATLGEFGGGRGHVVRRMVKAQRVVVNLCKSKTWYDRRTPPDDDAEGMYDAVGRRERGGVSMLRIF